MNQYIEVQEIYKMRMSPTVVTLVQKTQNVGLNIVKKQIMKNMLFGNNMLA